MNAHSVPDATSQAGCTVICFIVRLVGLLTPVSPVAAAIGIDFAFALHTATVCLIVAQCASAGNAAYFRNEKQHDFTYSTQHKIKGQKMLSKTKVKTENINTCMYIYVCM
ncbi:unnamed protein product [Ceratitis capitata]|uniref:(Mediterranean fruit fly) hypothetical protein n=1 Tax=Ceratitis capitata TaxID=7213 RepID=A0A811UFN2_CERCA|nr:unnamed protein product [Ceratitis capitata]